MNKKVSIRELTLEAFKAYGSFSNVLEPEGTKFEFGPIEFFPDMGVLNLGQINTVGFSVFRIQKRANILDAMEYHAHTSEGILPLNGDILLSVAPVTPNNVVPLDKIEVFRVLKGTLITVRQGVWHGAPYVENSESVNVLLVLPERTYSTDLVFCEIPKENQIQIIKT